MHRERRDELRTALRANPAAPPADAAITPGENAGVKLPAYSAEARAGS
jgi:hypothetical protein